LPSRKSGGTPHPRQAASDASRVRGIPFGTKKYPRRETVSKISGSGLNATMPASIHRILSAGASFQAHIFHVK
jgi:hypothetical protein